jgi:hypothetical protein
MPPVPELGPLPPFDVVLDVVWLLVLDVVALDPPCPMSLPPLPDDSPRL